MRIEYKRLKDCCSKIGSGATPKGGSSVYIDSGVSLIRSQNVYNLKFSYSGLAHINDEAANKLKGVIVNKGDVLLNITGDSVARTCVVPDEVLPARVNQHVSIIRPNKDVDSRYLNYYLASPAMQGYLLNIASTGASRNAITKGMIEKLVIPFPDMDSQRRIASILSAYDNLIENNNKRIRLLEQMAENLYKEWFVRFRFPGHEKAEFENGVPKGWKSIRIKELSQLKSGYAFKSEWFVEEGESVAKIKDIGGTLMDTSDFSHVDRNNCIKAKRFLLVEGNLTIALTGATIGKISIVPRHDGNIYTNQRLGKFFMGDNPIENLPFLYCLFKQEAMVSTIINISNSSSAQPNISPEQIENLKIIGNKEAIAKFNEALKPMFSMILSIHSQNEQLTRQRDLLLPRLMSGKLEVNI